MKIEVYLQSFYLACKWDLLISISGASLSAERAAGLLGVKTPAGSPCHTDPAGVFSRLPFQSTEWRNQMEAAIDMYFFIFPY
ncbi:hypothetical protein [Bacillus badius]|uniref:hypothetical protein n=1 Tax=Bacillus badius TaxID=1455 RepID=UPI000596E209|nr:hypothetical protein [Bacillus badius]MED4718755.1 hypothetical protein [Bacillus badius]